MCQRAWREVHVCEVCAHVLVHHCAHMHLCERACVCVCVRKGGNEGGGGKGVGGDLTDGGCGFHTA